MEKEQKTRQRGIFEDYLIPFTARLSKISYLKALQETFCTIMPLIILLALIRMAGSLVLNPLGPVMMEDGLGLGTFLSGGLHDQAYRDSGLFRTLSVCTDYLNITDFIYYLVFAVILTGKLAHTWHVDKILPVLCTLTCYVLLLSLFNEGMENVSLFFQGRGFFLSLLIATVNVLAFRRFSKMSIMRTPLPLDLSPRLVYSMRHFIAISMTMCLSLVTVLSWILVEKFVGSLPAFLASHFSQNVAQNPLVAMFYEFFRRFFWWLGLNGSSLTFSWAEAFYVPAQYQNEMEGASFIFTMGFFDALSISLLGLAVSIWVFSFKKRLRSISAYSLPFLLFSINEPFLFALPIVLNPLFLIPYLLAPMVNVLIGYIAIDCGIVPVFSHTFGSTAPVLLEGFLATGDIMGAVLQLVWLSVDIVIYTPFVIIINMREQDERLTAEESNSPAGEEVRQS